MIFFSIITFFFNYYNSFQLLQSLLLQFFYHNLYELSQSSLLQSFLISSFLLQLVTLPL